MGILNNQLPHSKHGLKGSTPAKVAGAVAPTGLHGGPNFAEGHIHDHSVHDLDGKTPSKYLDNPPK